MSKPFHCSIVTPSESLFNGEVTYASVPAWDGQFGVMDSQSPLLTRLDTGTLRIDTADGERSWYMVDGGFAQIADNTLTLLTEMATISSDLSAEEADAELAEAAARVAQSGQDLERVQRDQQRAYAKRQTIREASAS